MTNISPPPKPPTPPPKRIVKEGGDDFKWSKWDSLKVILLFLLIFLAIPPVVKLYLLWFAIWS